MVLTTASTTTASATRLPRDWRPAAMAACCAALVSWSRTTVWASTPLMKMGTGSTPWLSISLGQQQEDVMIENHTRGWRTCPSILISTGEEYVQPNSPGWTGCAGHSAPVCHSWPPPCPGTLASCCALYSAWPCLQFNSCPHLMSCGMYSCWVMTCLRYSSTPTTGAPLPRSGPSRWYQAM